MATLEIELRKNRTAEDVYADVALINGYSDTVTEETQKREEDIADDWTEPENAEDVRYVSNEDGTTDVEYTLVEEVENPKDQQEFGKTMVRKRFAELDANAEAEATKLRAKERYEKG